MYSVDLDDCIKIGYFTIDVCVSLCGFLYCNIKTRGWTVEVSQSK